MCVCVCVCVCGCILKMKFFFPILADNISITRGKISILIVIFRFDHWLKILLNLSP